MFVPKFNKQIPELKFYPPIINHVNFKRKFGELETFPELILSFNGHICTLLTSPRMPKFDSAWTEKLFFFYLPTLMFCSFFHNLSGSGRESGPPKKNGGSPTI